jgi:glutamate-1-semialdehyde 2,1-aminomutase
LLVVGPGDDPVRVSGTLDAHPRLIGLKPYHSFASRQNTFEAPLGEYLPEWCWLLAEKRRLVILIHLVRARALADPGNLRELRERCRAFPEARVVLAHAGRGFHAPDTVKGVTKLRGLGNIWFDTSAICESTPLLAILEAFGPRRLLWGSDWPVSEQRGKCVTVGDGFAWINPERVDKSPTSPPVRTRSVGEESLAAVHEAARGFGLDRADLRDIFHDNAARLFGLPHSDSTDVQGAHSSSASARRCSRRVRGPPTSGRPVAAR